MFGSLFKDQKCPKCGVWHDDGSWIQEVKKEEGKLPSYEWLFVCLDCFEDFLEEPE